MLRKREPKAYLSGNVILSSDPNPVSTQQVAWLGACWMILRYARRGKKAMTKKLEEQSEKKKKAVWIHSKGSFIQPSLKMGFHCSDHWTCSGSWVDHPGCASGSGCTPGWLLVRSWDSSCPARLLCCFCYCFSWALRPVALVLCLGLLSKPSGYLLQVSVKEERNRCVCLMVGAPRRVFTKKKFVKCVSSLDLVWIGKTKQNGFVSTL